MEELDRFARAAVVLSVLRRDSLEIDVSKASTTVHTNPKIKSVLIPYRFVACSV